MKKKTLENEERIVIGHEGYVGRAIYELFNCHAGIDINSKKGELQHNTYRILHICIPGNIPHFINIVCNYIKELTPHLALIHSTVSPGTTRIICETSGFNAVHVPFHGKHTEGKYSPVSMLKDPYRYIMSVGSIDMTTGADVCAYVQRFGFKSELFTPETTELAKIMSTELQRYVAECWNTYHKSAVDYGASWDGMCRIIKDIADHEPFGYLNRTYQVPGDLDNPLSKKHCISSNMRLP